MRPILLSCAILGSLVAASSAMAADLTATGSIKALDAKACTVTLADNKVYQFPAKCDFSKLKASENVVITYTVKGAANAASKIAAA